ncbi:MAG: hypothetical protein QM652_05405 [Legionella sp.]|uniref:hypothetical protein n=1 Tax=Legionella sp. TaxID=459 RepID=UPI0039E214AA
MKMSNKLEKCLKKLEENFLNPINLKKKIRYLSCLLFVFTFLSLSIETALKSGTASSYADLLSPITYSFYWPRFTLLLMPSLAIILLSAHKKKQSDYILQGLLLFMAPIIVSSNLDIFSAYNLVPNLNQPKHFMQLYHFVTAANAALWMVIIMLGLIWLFQKPNYITDIQAM